MTGWMGAIARRGVLKAMAVALPLGLGALGAAQPAHAADQPVVVFAAASLKNALDAVIAGWSKDTGKTATVSYASSSALAKQIEQGAPADIFISADLAWMDYVGKANAIKTDTRENLLGNKLVLVAPADSTATVEIKEGLDLAALLGDGRLAVGQVDSVPAGKYAKTALTNLGIWPSVQGKLAQADNVRAALLLVSRGEAPLGIVYATDAASDKKVKIIGTFPEGSHAPIIYPVAVTASSTNPDADSLYKALHTGPAAAAFTAEGFTVLVPPASN
ncbi:molybdate ABC transporter substrate-binding protein [Segnochrobactraceae bacterium EtOH-i3]